MKPQNEIDNNALSDIDKVISELSGLRSGKRPVNGLIKLEYGKYKEHLLHCNAVYEKIMTAGGGILWKYNLAFKGFTARDVHECTLGDARLSALNTLKGWLDYEV